MVNDLRELLSANVASPPHDDLEMATVLTSGRRRVRRRRLTALGGTAAVTAVLVATASLTSLNVRAARLRERGGSAAERTDASTG